MLLRPGPIVVASHNPGKAREIVELLGPFGFEIKSAAELGLPFAFASHFAPDYLEVALALYRREFQPSAALDRPYPGLRGQRRPP